MHRSTAKRAWDERPTMGSVLTGGSEACGECGPNFKPLAHLVVEISADTSFPIVTLCWGPTISFRCEPAVCILLSIAVSGCILLSIDVYCCIWLYNAVYCCLLLYIAVYCCIL